MPPTAVTDGAVPAIADPRALSQLESYEQRELLDAIDRLRRENVGADISLPQIVVCGDQSSGKSSVLEAIAQVLFPVGSGTTTRFPTEVILRHAPKRGFKITLQAALGRGPEQKQHIEAFKHRHPFCGPEDFPYIVSEASEYLRAYEPACKFWNDWLRAEFSGPSQSHLTLIDLPGLIQSEGENANPGDKQKIKDMVKGYISDESAVVLAVVNALNDVDNQEITQLVREAGTAASRTIGVITKPDRLEVSSDDEKKAVRLARNEGLRLGLGWHVLKNMPHEKARSADDRDDAERNFFSQGLWAELSRDDVGVEALRQKLNLNLLSCITKDLPRLVADMQRKYSKCQARFKQLGDARESLGDQREYLARIQSRMQRLVEAALDGDYTKSEFEQFFDGSRRKGLRDMINGESDAFAARIRRDGKQYNICTTPFFKDMAELNFFVPYELSSGKPGTSSSITLRRYCKQLAKFMDETRGRNLRRTLTTETVKAVFRQQSVFWDRLARQYVDQCFAGTFDFLKAAIVHIAGRHTAEKLMKRFMEQPFDRKGKQLEEKVSELLWPYQHCHPITYNPKYGKALAAADWLGKVENSSYKRWEHLARSELRLDDRLVSAAKALDETDVYYEVALDTFVDNTTTLAIEAVLLSDLPELISASDVFRLEPDEVAFLAAEPPEAQQERSKTQAQSAALEVVIRTCKRHATQGRDEAVKVSQQQQAPVGTSNTFGSLFNQPPGHKVPSFTPQRPLFASQLDSHSRPASQKENSGVSQPNKSAGPFSSWSTDSGLQYAKPGSSQEPKDFFTRFLEGGGSAASDIFKSSTQTNGAGRWFFPSKIIEKPQRESDQIGLSQCLTAHDEFARFSLEELRLEDYMAGRKSTKLGTKLGFREATG